MIVALAVLLLFTFSVRKNIPADYFSVNGVVNAVSLELSSLTNRIDFAVRDRGLSPAAALEAFNVTPSKQVLTFGSAHDVPVLLYHGIVEHPDRFSMTPETFKDQMFALKRAGYHTVSIDDFHQFMQGNKTLPDKSFLLTFDDGREDSYYGADPVLHALGFSAVMFVATADSLETPDSPKSYYLHTPLLHLMVESGRWEIGSHAIQQPFGPGGFIPIASNPTTLGNFLSNKMWLASENRLEIG